MNTNKDNHNISLSDVEHIKQNQYIELTMSYVQRVKQKQQNYKQKNNRHAYH